MSISYRWKARTAMEKSISDLCSFGLLHLLKLFKGRSWSRGVKGKIPYTTTFPNYKTIRGNVKDIGAYIHDHISTSINEKSYFPVPE